MDGEEDGEFTELTIASYTELYDTNPTLSLAEWNRLDKRARIEVFPIEATENKLQTDKNVKTTVFCIRGQAFTVNITRIANTLAKVASSSDIEIFRGDERILNERFEFSHLSIIDNRSFSSDGWLYIRRVDSMGLKPVDRIYEINLHRETKLTEISSFDPYGTITIAGRYRGRAVIASNDELVWGKGLYPPDHQLPALPSGFEQTVPPVVSSKGIIYFYMNSIDAIPLQNVIRVRSYCLKRQKYIATMDYEVKNPYWEKLIDIQPFNTYVLMRYRGREYGMNRLLAASTKDLTIFSIYDYYNNGGVMEVKTEGKDIFCCLVKDPNNQYKVILRIWSVVRQEFRKKQFEIKELYKQRCTINPGITLTRHNCYELIFTTRENKSYKVILRI